MSRKLASIQTITNISPIEGKDKIKLARILGWNVIVDSSYNIGEDVIFIEVDSVLPVKPEFEFLRKRCFSESQGGFVIKTMKMAGVISQGIVFHISDILCIDKMHNFINGMDVTDIIGIKQREDNSDNLDNKNEQCKKSWYKTILYRIPYYNKLIKKFKMSGNFPSQYITKSDETRIQSLGNKFLTNYLGIEYIITEKIEGQSATYVLKKCSILGFNKYIFACYGRNTKVDMTHNIYKYAIDNNIKEKMINILNNTNAKYVAIQGEMTGPGIQKNIYNFDKHHFFIFKIFIDNNEQSFDDISGLCDAYSMTSVPLIKRNTLTAFEDVDYWAKYSTGQSLCANRLREGVVVRSIGIISGLHGFSFKSVSPEYCLERGY